MLRPARHVSLTPCSRAAWAGSWRVGSEDDKATALDFRWELEGLPNGALFLRYDKTAGPPNDDPVRATVAEWLSMPSHS